MELSVLAKYFAHGILFSLISVALFLLWFVVTLVLVMFGFIIGLLIGLGLLFLIVGFINGVLGSFLWDIKRNEGFVSTLVHGFVLGIIFLLVSLVTYYLPTLFFPSLVTQAVAFIITTLIDGAVGKQVASWFRGEPEEPQYEDVEARESVSSGISYTQPAPKEISEALPMCPLCQNKTEWKAYYKQGQGLKPYNIMCSVCHAEWENPIIKPMITGEFGTIPQYFPLLENILVLRNAGNNPWARIYLNREIRITTWKEMVKKS